MGEYRLVPDIDGHRRRINWDEPGEQHGQGAELSRAEIRPRKAKLLKPSGRQIFTLRLHP